MEDFIFGTMATDELKVVHHRATRAGARARTVPRDPPLGEAVTVRAAPQTCITGAALYTTDVSARWLAGCGVGRAGDPLRQVRFALCVGLHVGVKTIPQPEGTVVRHRIGAWADGPGELFADVLTPARSEQAAAAYFRRQPMPGLRPTDPPGTQTFTFHVDRLAPPDWARNAVIYQIFVDRFYPGDGRDWLQTEDLRDFYGGTLWGVRDKLDYIEALGATCIWLTPIFPSPTPHGYDATDFTRIEPRVGGEEALRAVVEGAHARGIRVLLDYACSHVSSAHPFFVDALNDPASPYRDWFYFDDSPLGYRAFFGVASMPTLNVAHAPVREHLIDVARMWLREFDVDGYRLDYASGPGPDFWADFWAACKAEKPDSFCMGEVVDAPDVQRRYVGRLDGCLDFHLTDALRKTFAWGRWSETTLSGLSSGTSVFPPVHRQPSRQSRHGSLSFIAGTISALRRAARTRCACPARRSSTTDGSRRPTRQQE